VSFIVKFSSANQAFVRFAVPGSVALSAIALDVIRFFQEPFARRFSATRTLVLTRILDRISSPEPMV
jgi:hypothetical protein